MANLREEVPAEFTDDERWWKFFTKRSVLVLGGALAFTFLLAKLFSLIRLTAVGLIIGSVIGIAVFFITVFKWPISDTMNGAGCTLAEIIYRTKCRKRSARIFVKLYETGENNL